MTRTFGKVPQNASYLLKKAEAARASGRREVIELPSRRSEILPQFVGLTFGVRTGHKHVSVLVSEDMIGQKFGAIVPRRARGQTKYRTRLKGEPASPTALCSTSRPIAEKASNRRAIAASAYTPGPRARAVLRGVEIAQEDLRKSGGAYDLGQVRRLLHGASRQAVESLISNGRLLVVPGPNNEARFPAVQFKDDGGVVAGLGETQSALATKNAFAILNFLVSPDTRLDGRKPIDLLRAGAIERVVEAARRVGEQGA